ncbi:MAG: hypothetical protein N2999_06030 [Proteobacteria bacterium]|nr:hypothetical protein [Pseudomonadota bacterium]
MGSTKAYKYYCLIFFVIFFSCSQNIKVVEEKNLTGRLIRVEINNHSYEIGITHLFKNIIERDIIKRGGEAVESGESLLIQVDILDVKAIPASFDKKDVANSYNLNVKTDIKIYGLDKETRRLIKSFKLTPVNNYTVKSLTDAEIERQISLEKSASEISSVILSSLATLP